MTIHYRNTKEDYIEVNKFIIRRKLYRFMSNCKHYKFNITHYLYYLRYFVFLYCLIMLIYIYMLTKDLSYIYPYLLSSLFTSLAGYLFIDSILAIHLNNSVDKIIKQKPYILQNKTITIKDDYLELSMSSTKNIKINIKDICKIVENQYNLYIFFNKYKDFQVIPYSTFEKIDDRNIFLKKLG